MVKRSSHHGEGEIEGAGYLPYIYYGCPSSSDQQESGREFDEHRRVWSVIDEVKFEGDGSYLIVGARATR